MGAADELVERIDLPCWSACCARDRSPRRLAVLPENTLAAFELAIRMGADFVEFDVHNDLSVTHDPTAAPVSCTRSSQRCSTSATAASA